MCFSLAARSRSKRETSLLLIGDARFEVPVSGEIGTSKRGQNIASTVFERELLRRSHISDMQMIHPEWRSTWNQAIRGLL